MIVIYLPLMPRPTFIFLVRKISAPCRSSEFVYEDKADRPVYLVKIVD